MALVKLNATRGLTGALPAVSGASLTGLDAGKIGQVIYASYATDSNFATSSFVDISSGVGSLPISFRINLCVLTILLIVSIICTGIRIVLAWSSIDLVIACLIHQVA